ncbi:magnesium-chelatase 60 kDa subunit [Ahrensia sp. R2A130]|nr:magnesium-chelatase 60 kDa subunit [Ahrensia sp. R2A130]
MHSVLPDIPRLPAPPEAEVALWDDACLAADLFAAMAAEGRVGIRIRASAGPVRDAWMARLAARLGETPIHRVPSAIALDRLLGGLDLAATLETGRTVLEEGLLAKADDGVLVLQSAGATGETVASICAAFDDGFVRIERDGASHIAASRFSLIVFDESEDGDEPMAEALTDRLALHIDLRQIGIRALDSDRLRSVSNASATAQISGELLEAIAAIPPGFGLTSLRVSLQLAAVTRAIAVHSGRAEAIGSDLEVACRLCLINRATMLPAPPETEQEQQEETPPPPPPEQESSERPDNDADDCEVDQLPPLDMVLDAITAQLPDGLLEQLMAARTSKTRSKAETGRVGKARKALDRGRPLTSRKGRPGSGNRLDLIATLRTAAPWQKLRAREDDPRPIQIRAGDLHVRRYKEKSASSVIFAVDASGSTALNRLAEAKGAVELLLGESYARRDHVGLISFRGQTAEMLLAPTRSLLRAKRALAALPGGGGTPLADALRLAAEASRDEQDKGRTPTIVIMTDGSANVALDGTGGRSRAGDEALASAHAFATTGANAVLLDVGRRPSAKAKALAEAMAAAYVPMPFANAATLSAAVRTAN